MKLFKIILPLLLLTGVHAKGAKWQKLKPLEDYPPTAYTLDQRVGYMEIRGYNSRKSKEAFTVLPLYTIPLNSYSPDIVKKFSRLKPKYTEKSNINSFFIHGNAFFIDKNGKMFQMDMKEDITGLLGKIDTPAELQLVLKLSFYEQGQYYRKTAKGYEVKIFEHIKGCVYSKRTVLVDKDGDITDKEFSYFRKGCKNRRHTQFINNKKNSYESYNAIAIDSKENLYVIGSVKKGKKFDAFTSFYVLDKYTRNGKHVWSRVLKGNMWDRKIVVDGNTVYLLNEKGVVAKYSSTGKKQSLNKHDRLKFTKKTKTQSIQKGKYLVEGLPSPKDNMKAQISAYTTDKKGNTYVVGSEVFYPSGTPDEVPSGECGNVEEVNGAFIAKLNSKGKTVWAKVIDRNE